MGTPRYREETDDDIFEETEQVYEYGGTGGTFGPWLTHRFSRSISDVVTKDYRRKIAAGQIINNPCNISESYTTSTGSGSIHYEPPSKVFHYDTNGPTSQHNRSGIEGFWDGLELESAPFSESRLKQVALANIDNTPFAFGEDALEVRETLRFLRNPLTGLYALSRAYYRAFLKRRKSQTRWRKIRRNAESLAATHAAIWLQFQFAIQPLVRSSIDALEAYSAVITTPPARQNSRGIGVENLQTIESFADIGTKQFRRQVSRESSGKASILYEVSNPLYDWKYKLGFRVKDLPTTVWQVMPYSFMIDRVVDISSFSKGVMNLLDPNVKILAASYRSKVEDRTEYEFLGRPFAGFQMLATNVVKTKSFIYDRQVWTPTILDAVPGITPGYLIEDATKIADLVALIVANLKGIKP